MKTLVTMPRAMGGMDAQVVDIGETEREFQADLPLLEPLDMNMVTRAKNDPFQHSKRAGEREQAQGATVECASRTLPHLCITIVFVGGTQTTRRLWCGRNHENSKEVHTCKAGFGFRSGTRATSTPYTMQRTLLKWHPDRHT